MPLEVLVKFKSGKESIYYIPIDLMRGEKKKPEYARNWNIIDTFFSTFKFN